MGVTEILTSNGVTYRDDFLALRLWRPLANPPYGADDDLPMFEGGVVASAAGDILTLGTARQAHDPQTGDDSYATTLSADHALPVPADGSSPWLADWRLALFLTGALAGETYKVTANGALSITCAGADFSTVIAGDVVVLCDRIYPTSPASNRQVSRMQADFKAGLNGPVPPSLADRGWIYWRKQIDDGASASGWIDIGWFDLEVPQAEFRGRERPTSLTAYDGLRWFDQPYTGSFSPDAIAAHQRATASAGTRCVVMKMVDESQGPLVGSPPHNADGFYRFFDSPESVAANIVLNHTTNWAALPAAILYASADSNDTVSDGDIAVPYTDAVQVLRGTGEVRIQAGWWYDKLVEMGLPAPASVYLKTRYTRLATELDQLRGTITTLAGATLTNASFTGNLALPTTGDGLADSTLRLTSGLARGQTFTIASNTGSTITATVNLEDAGVLLGDTFEVQHINDPLAILETLLLATGYQMQDDILPLYVAPLSPILLPGYPAQVFSYQAAAYTDITDASQDFNSATAVLSASGDILYIRHGSRYTGCSVTVTAGWDGSVVYEYWNGAAWTALPTHGLTDTTAGLTATGDLRWNPPNDFALTTVNSALGFYTRWRCTSAPSAALSLYHLQLAAQPSAPPASEADWLRADDQDNRPAAEVWTDLRRNGLVPPNWILRAAPNGQLTGQSYRQSTTADWSFNHARAYQEQPADQPVYTELLYRGFSNSQVDLALSATGVTIQLCTTLQAKIALWPADGSVQGYDSSISPDALDYLINGIDLREHQFSGAYYVDRFCLTTGEGSTHINELSNQELYYIDFGQLYSDWSEVRLVIDDDVYSYNRKIHRVANESPIFALEVSAGGAGTDDTWDWVPLCDRASAVQTPQKVISEQRFTSGDSGWQASWRYLRKKSILAGLVGQGSTLGWTRQTSGDIEYKCYRNQELTSLLRLGLDTPFTTTADEARRRRHGVKRFVVPTVDYAADTDEKTRARGVAYLRELRALNAQYVIDDCRPDADLFDTASADEPRLPCQGSFLIMGLTIQAGAAISAVVRDYSGAA